MAVASEASVVGTRVGHARRRKRIGDPGQVLNYAVVQVLGDAPALERRGVEGAPEERLTLLLAPAKALGERPRQRQL